MDYNKFLNNTAKEIRPSGIRKFFDVVSVYPDAISLGVGEPDFRTPYFIGDRAIKSIAEGKTQYTSNDGLKDLRNYISKYLETRFNVYYTPNQILVTVGASEAIDLALRATINIGDEVLIPDPSYVSYYPCVKLAGGTPVSVPCSDKDNFILTPAMLESVITKNTKAIILPYPNNPTGAIMTKQDLEAIAKIIIKYDLLIISDEIYAELTYSTRHFSVASLDGMSERCIYINGFSKAFAMTGWRLGYLCAPKPIYDVIYKIHQYCIMCAPTASQYAGLEALKRSFDDDFSVVESMRESYDQRRRFMVKTLNEIGLKCFEPKGAFYLFPYVGHLGMNGSEFSMSLLEHKKVVVVPGDAFGESGKDFVRISYAYSMTKLMEATERIKEFIDEL